MAGGGARKCAGSLQRRGSRKRTLKSLILEEEGNERKGIETERDRERERRAGWKRERGKIRTPPNLCADSRTDEASCRVSRACFSFGYTLSDNATRREGYAGKYRGMPRAITPFIIRRISLRDLLLNR